MKKESYAIIVLTVLSIMFIGCNGDSYKGPLIPDSASTTNTVPKINSVGLYNDESPMLIMEAYSGDELVASINFGDEDHDIRRVYVEFYHESDGYTELKEEKEMEVPPTNSTYFTYKFHSDPYTVSDTTGFWRVIFYCVDYAGHESNEYQIDLLVR